MQLEKTESEMPKINFLKNFKILQKKISKIEVLRQNAPSKNASVMESSTISNAQELHFWLFSVNRPQLEPESFAQVGNPELPVSR